MIAVKQVPQLPARHPDAMSTPFASAKSKIVPDAGVQSRVFPDFANVKGIAAVASVPSLVAAGGAAFFTDAGPKAS
jgi:hypothetical protein